MMSFAAFSRNQKAKNSPKALWSCFGLVLCHTCVLRLVFYRTFPLAFFNQFRLCMLVMLLQFEGSAVLMVITALLVSAAA